MKKFFYLALMLATVTFTSCEQGKIETNTLSEYELTLKNLLAGQDFKDLLNDIENNEAGGQDIVHFLETEFPEYEEMDQEKFKEIFLNSLGADSTIVSRGCNQFNGCKYQCCAIVILYPRYITFGQCVNYYCS